MFGLFFVTVNFGLMLAGLDFHSFSNREVVGASDSEKSQILFNQLALYAVIYVLILPIVLAVFEAGFLPWNLFSLFLAILVLEHLSYEAYRLFVPLGRPLTASVIVFIRGASWVLLLPLLFVWREDLQTLHTVLVLWLLGGLLSLSYTGFELYRSGWSFSRVTVDVRWILRGLRVAMPFFIGTIAIRSVFTLDRFFIEAFSNMSVVGVYTFYTGMCVALLGLIEASVFSFSYPKLISAANSSDPRTFFLLLRRLALQTTIATSAIALLIYYLSRPLILLIDKIIYLEYLHIFELLLIAFSLFIISSVPQFALYAIKCDITILRCNLIALVVFLVSMTAFYNFKPELIAVPTSMIIAFGVMLVIKSLYLLRKGKQFFAA